MLSAVKKPQPVVGVSPKTNPNLQFFGYTLVDIGWDDPTDDETKNNYLDEVSGWPSGFDFEESIGARHFPDDILDIHKEIGREITGK